MHPNDPASLRVCAASMIASVEAYQRDADLARLKAGLLAAVTPVIQRPDLYSLGAYRRGNHISNSKYIYYDGELCLTLDEFPKGKVIPPHDHGVWEAIALCRGSMKHVVYDRRDDRKTEGHADLVVAEEMVMGPGDISMVMPPDDIHSFLALEDNTFGITIVGGEYSVRRRYFDTENKTYVIQTPKGLMQSVDA